MKTLFRATLVLVALAVVASCAEAVPGLAWVHRVHEKRVERGAALFPNVGRAGAGCQGTAPRGTGCQGSVTRGGCQGFVNPITPVPAVPVPMPGPAKKN